jgi:hypothetical protein
MGAAEAADPKGVAGKGRRRPAARLGGPTMSKVRKWDGEGTAVGTRGNGEVAPITDSPAAAPIPPDANKSCTVQAFNAGPVSSTIPAGGRWRQSMWAGRTAHLPESSRRKLPPKRSEPCRVMRSSQAAGRKPVKADIGTTLVSLGSPSLSQTFRNAFARSSTSRSLWNGVGVMRSRSVPRGTVG